AFALGSRTFTAYLSGKWALLGALPSTLHARRAIQRARVRRDRDLLVGGPLTLSPQIRSRLGGVLDALLRAWWSLVRALCLRSASTAETPWWSLPGIVNVRRSSTSSSLPTSTWSIAIGSATGRRPSHHVGSRPNPARESRRCVSASRCAKRGLVDVRL